MADDGAGMEKEQAARGAVLRRWGAGMLASCLLALALPAAAQTVPAAPAGLVAVAGAGQVELRWNAAANVAYYETRYAVGSGAFGAWTRFDAPSTSFTVSGLGSALPHRFQLRAVNGAGAGPSAEVTATPSTAPDFTPEFTVRTGPALVYRVGSPVRTVLPRAFAANTYAVTPDLPEGLVMNPLSAVVRGTPTTAQARTRYTLTAFDDDDQDTLPFTIEVQEDLMPTFAESVAAQTYRVGTAIRALQLPTAVGGDGDVAHQLTPALPPGLALDAERRTITGTPTAVSPRTTYTWTATDEDGDETALTFAIDVRADSMPAFQATVADQTYRVGNAVSLSLPRATGGDGALSYSLTPALPRGLALDARRRMVAGTPRAASRRTTYTWTVTDEDGDSASVTFAVEVEPDLMPTFSASVADQRYNRSAAIQPLVLPNASGGDGALAYRLSPALPPGLAFDLGSRTIAGTPSAESPRTEYTWTATDEDGDTAALTFAIEVGIAVTVAIADASATEGATLSFAVTLSGALPVPVTVAYRTVDDTARAGEDYAAASGTLTFAPGTTRLGIDVAVASDQLAEHDETFAVVLAELVHAEFEDARATGTIVDDDVERARGDALSQALGVFGTAFAADAVDAVSGRFQEGPPTAPAVPGSARAGGFGLAATVAGFFAGGSEQRPASKAALPHGAPFASIAARLDRQGDGAGLGSLPLSGAFQMPFGGGDHADRGQWTLWGRGSTSRISSDVGFAVDGRVDSAYLGVDARMPRNTLLGMAVARSSGEFDYRQAGVSEGELEMEMTAFLPYVHWTLCNGTDLWAMAGAGNGDATLTDNLGGVATDTSLRLAAAGLRRELATSETLAWALKADAAAARLRADEVLGAIAAADADVERLRLLVEGRRDWAGEQSRVGASFEIGARYDGGDVDSGLSAEIGGALDYRNLPLGLGLEARGRYLAGHAQSALDEWGLSAALELDPGARGSGASLRLAPAWGAPSSGVAELWRADRMVGESARRGFGGRLPSRLDMEVGYGFASKRTGAVRVFGVLGGGSQPSFRLGARSAERVGFGWRIEIDRVQRIGGQTDHGILFSIGNAPAGLVASMAQSFHDEAARW